MLATASWRSLGTSAHLVTHDLDLATARTAVERVLDDVDATYSRFRADSELRRLQAQTGRDIRVSPLLGQAVEAALRAARDTDGAVDPTIGRQMRAIGYDEDFTRVASRGVPLTIRIEPVAGWRVLRFDARTRSLVCPRASRSTSGQPARLSPRTSRPTRRWPGRRPAGCSSAWVATSRRPAGRRRAGGGSWRPRTARHRPTRPVKSSMRRCQYRGHGGDRSWRGRRSMARIDRIAVLALA